VHDEAVGKRHNLRVIRWQGGEGKGSSRAVIE
jgi:hypothetical protein